ncbi:dienelactone hydrolase family protein [Fulvivirga sp. 29W222]|uniref:Dienelactone hydrolase family protein n=1 Tax=Fulvivirga marina TaxID=2494733 RepID=A0A937G238_9BACT|nr:alpha/beta fold hydrolase [Fulvivirga marina]MBL6448628.1 dienelactone hydrolase family protein [Fulvivirga marina]
MTNSLKIHDDIVLNSKHHKKKILVDARYISNQHKKPVIIFIHGFKGFKDWGHFNVLADEMAKAGYVFIKFNLSHNGTTPEHPVDFVDLDAFSENNFSIELDDTGTVIDYLFSEECVISSSEMNTDNLFLMGHSRGGGLALLKTAEDDRVKAVATWAAVADFNRWTKALLNEWQQDEVIYILNGRTGQKMPMKYQIVEDLEKNQDRLSISKAVSSLAKPVLVVHGTEDETVSSNDAQKIHELARDSALLLIDKANHVFGASHPYKGCKLPAHAQLAFDRTYDFFESLRSI